MEQWKTLTECADYMISNYGRMKSLKRGREIILKPSLTHDGYVKQALSINGKSVTFRVHRLVAKYFLPPKKENETTINHKDGDKTNNHANNLEWANLSEQMQHAYKLGLKKPVRGTMQGNAVLNKEQVLYIRKMYKPHNKEYGAKALAEKFNVSVSVIAKVTHYKSYLDVE